MECLYCGKHLKIIFREKIRKFCSDSCKNKYHAQLRKNKTKYCLECGKKLEGGQRKYCCEECRYKAQLKRQQAERDQCKKPKAEENPEAKKRGRPRKHGLTLAEINARAREEGLNYGQYVAKYGL